MTSGASAPDPVVASVVVLVPAWRVDKEFDYLVPDDTGEVQVGSLVRVPFGARKVRGLVTRVERRAPERELEAIAGVLLGRPIAPGPLVALLEWVARRYAVTRAAAFERAVPPRVRVKVVAPSPSPTEPPPESLARYVGADALLDALASRRPGTWCLRPAPSEDRARLVAELAAAASRAAAGPTLVAVPEVAYGSPVLEGLTRWFPDIARVDSAQPDADRARAWMRLAAGHGAGIGGRATVFAPAPRLGLILLDDEDHPSYKEDRAPRYDARRVAMERARLQGAVCILMSATPSIETGAAAVAGRIGYVYPTREAERATRPIVETFERPTERALSHEFHVRIRDALRAAQRVALLVPMRGYARSLWCANCKRSVRCPRCETGMIYERDARSVRCPRCELRREAPDVCPHCGSTELRYLGAGSERLAEQVAAAFPRARVERMDPAALASGAERTEPDIYVTTWIGTKEAVRPTVSVVGVVDADALIRRPDFRAAEYAYQAIAQMAQWAGPAAEGGRLLVQTSEPSHPAIQAVARADYGYFLDKELQQRSELRYPPFSELVQVVAAGPDVEDIVARVVAAAGAASGRVLGPIPGHLDVGDERLDASELLIKCPDAGRVAEALRVILAETPLGNRLRVDVDPR